MIRLALISAVSLCACVLQAQVANNAIKNRLELPINDTWYTSSTYHASVEWDCINKVLTNKCLVYHNDQWFTIVPPKTGNYYVNISNQKCQNLQGVQIVVLEGDPCKIDSYQLRICISYTEQSDLYVRMDSLIGGKEYLVNIDGYLGDQCDFLIQFSTNPRGVPVQGRNMKSIALKVTNIDSLITLNWSIPDSLVFKYTSFQVYRKHDKEKAASPIYSTTLTRNAYGDTETGYTTLDTLRKNGQYSYRVYGVTSANEMVMLAAENIIFRTDTRVRALRQQKATINFVSPKAGLVNVTVLNSADGKQLFSTTRRVDQGKNSVVLDLSEYVENGVYHYKILIGDKTFQQEHHHKVRKTRRGGRK